MIKKKEIININIILYIFFENINKLNINTWIYLKVYKPFYKYYF